MKLTIGDEQFTEPNPEELELVLRLLGQPFAILERSESEFLQVGLFDSGYLVEVQQGSLEEFYQCTDRDLSLRQVIDMAQAYARGDDSWRIEYSWKRFKPGKHVRRV